MLYYVPMPMVFPMANQHSSVGVSTSVFFWMFVISVILTLLYIYLSRHLYEVNGHKYNYVKEKWETELLKVHYPAIFYVGLVICIFVPIANIALPLALLIVYFERIANTPGNYETDLKLINWLIK
jgi:magnesium-transporting ATPase (P-type)